MVSAGQVAAFGVAAFILIVIPGPSVLFVVGRALAHGRRTALASVVGNAVGVEVVAVCVALGIGTLVERSMLAFTVVKTGRCRLPGLAGDQRDPAPPWPAVRLCRRARRPQPA